MLTTFHFLILSRFSVSTPIKLVPLSDQIMAGVPLRDTNRSHNARTGVHGCNYLDKDSASSEVGEEEAPPFLSSTADSNIERPKVVNASVREGRRLVSNLSLGKSDIIGCIVTAWNSRHLVQCALMESKNDRSFSTV